ncbi:MAG: polysaccharide pyruvyl transferase family protein, partial [Armatimonadota bacterium]
MEFAKAPFLFVGNGSYANRGCEAITKSSVRLVREFFPEAPIINGNELGDYDQVDETEPDVYHVKCSCVSSAINKMWVSEQIYARTGLLIDLSSAGKMVRQWAPQCRAVVSMGGDLYGLSHGRRVLIQYLFLGMAALRVRRPFVIWCATIGNLDAAGRLKRIAMRHYKQCDLILVRDIASLEYLRANGVCENVRLVADPAFLLEPSEPRVPLPNKAPLEEMIGLNIASDYGSRGRLGSYRDMIKLVADCVESIQKTTGRSVLLVPHVVAYPEYVPGNDTIFLSLVRECLAERGCDVPLLPSSLRSWEIKWVLGRLHAYIGARMHSTVASLGSCTPTLSVTFSEKGPALNELLLGHRRFAFDCSELT